MILHVVLFRPRAALNTDARQRLAQAFADAVTEIGAIKHGSNWTSPDAWTRV